MKLLKGLLCASLLVTSLASPLWGGELIKFFGGVSISEVEVKDDKYQKALLVAPELAVKLSPFSPKFEIEGKVKYALGERESIIQQVYGYGYETKRRVWGAIKQYEFEKKFSYFVVENVSFDIAAAFKKIEVGSGVEKKDVDEKAAKLGVSYYLPFRDFQIELSPYLRYSKIKFEDKKFDRAGIVGQVGVNLNKVKISLFYEKSGNMKEKGVNFRVMF